MKRLFVINFFCNGVLALNHANCTNYNSQSNSIIVRETNGRLGNQMFVINMLAGLHLAFGYRPFIGEKTGKSLSKYFKDFSNLIPIAEENLCEFKHINSKFREDIREQRMQKIKNLIQKSVGKNINLEKDQFGRWTLPQSLINNYNIPLEE